MRNDPKLLAFNTWRAEHPDVETDIVSAHNDHETHRVKILWSGGASSSLAQLRREAQRRGITVDIQESRYTFAELNRAAEAIFDAVDSLEEIGFELSSIATDGDPEGLDIEGTDLQIPDSGDLEPLNELVGRVRRLVMGLDGVRGVLTPGDIRITPGRVYRIKDEATRKAMSVRSSGHAALQERVQAVRLGSVQWCGIEIQQVEEAV